MSEEPEWVEWVETRPLPPGATWGEGAVPALIAEMTADAAARVALFGRTLAPCVRITLDRDGADAATLTCRWRARERD